jgi:protein-S-isoprenylcysteine O-methyltransferase Ste14
MAGSATSSERPDTAGVIAPPPVIFAVALLLGWLIGWAVPLPFLPPALAAWLGTILVVIALALAGAGTWTMRRARTAVDPYHPSTALVRTGPFKYSRNPLYVALTMLSLAVALFAGSLWMALLVIPALVVLRFGVVAREEAYLGRKFGDEYRRYTGEVRRWL